MARTPAKPPPAPAGGADAKAAEKATETENPKLNPELDYEAQVAVLAEVLYLAARKAEWRKPPTERASDKALWKQARRTAATKVRQQRIRAKARAVTASAATSVYAEVRSVLHRNRRQLAPWMLTAPYVAAGETAHLLATYGSGVPVGISGLCALGAAGGSRLAWRRRLATRIPARHHATTQAGLGLLTGWTAAMPLVHGTGQAGMWLALIGGTAYMGSAWWRQHDHPIPLARDVAEVDLAVEEVDEHGQTERSATATELAFAERVMADWQTYVAGMGTLPGSTLSRPRRIEYGWTFSLNLVRGKQKLSDARTARDNIGSALNLDPKNISIDRDPHPAAHQTTVVLTVITDQITNTYTGPRIFREGGDVFIEVGPYEDGLGSERFHVLADQLTAEEIAAGQRPRGSMNGGFALGTKGSGKSRLMEELAVGLRKLGIELWYLDPQQGKSSPALMAEADWPLAGVHGTKGAYSNVIDLWRAVRAACEVREAEGGDAEQGFQHTRTRPAIMVMIDECHGVFQAENPETGQSFGQDFAELDRIMRKNGIGLFGASQAITQDTFGRGNAAAVLRDGMCAVNVFLMSYGGKNLKLAPGYDDQPCGSLPVGKGYGYNPKGARPQTRFQTRYTADFQPWLAKFPKATLDARVQKRIGETYTRRFEQHAENQAAKQAWLDALDAFDGDGSTLPAFGEQATNGKKTTENPTVTALLSPAQLRMQAVQATPTTTPSSAASGPGVGLTTTEQQVLDIVRDTPHNPTTLGVYLQISSQAAGKHLRNLETKGQVVKLPDGRYTAKA